MKIGDINNMKRDTNNNYGGLEMGHMKSWLMEHDECITDALHNGATTVNMVIAYCKTNMQMIDENYIVEQWNEFMAGPDRLTDEEILDLDNVYLSEQEHNFGDAL